MNAKELMIGDYVQTKAKRLNDEFEIEEFYMTWKIAEIGGIVTVEDGKNNKEPYHILLYQEIEPIPLTREILEANNIKYQWGMPWYQGGFDGTFELRYENSNGSGIGDRTTDLKLPIRYVHELQHAIKLCGIDKEIVL